nr:MAG TPA: hypothetical protein [Caudoviricetes sp.]DAO95619.1 MAG TPA: hypothetical protein [Caudoviricetes sp.]
MLWYSFCGATDKRQAVSSPDQIRGASCPLIFIERGADNGYIF